MIPANTNSHLIFFSRLGEGLAKLGHKVELLMPSNSRMYAKLSPYQTKNYNITRYPVMDDEPFVNGKESSEALLNIAYTKSDIQKLTKTARSAELRAQGYERDCLFIYFSFIGSKQKLQFKHKSNKWQKQNGNLKKNFENKY